MPAATQDIPPPPSFTSNSIPPPADTIPQNRSQHDRPQHDHPETAPLKTSSASHNVPVEPPPPPLPPESSVYVPKFPHRGVNLESDLPPSSPPSSKTKWLLLSGLAVTFLMCLGVAGTLYRNKDMLLSQLEGQAPQSTTDEPQANTAPTPEPEVLPEPEAPPEPEEPEIEAPEAPPEPTPQPTPSPSASNSASTTSAGQSTAPTADSQSALPSPPTIPRPPTRPPRPTPPPTPPPGQRKQPAPYAKNRKY